MTFADQLRAMGACADAVAWVGSRTAEQAWAKCERGDWMAWLTQRLDLDSRRVAADIAERVWHLVRPKSRLACAWAIDCARRGADKDERNAAGAAAGDAAGDAAGGAAGDAAWAAARAAAWAAARDAAGDPARAAAWAAAWGAAGDAAGDAAGRDAERRAQADIMREYFSWQKIAKAMVSCRGKGQT